MWFFEKLRCKRHYLHSQISGGISVSKLFATENSSSLKALKISSGSSLRRLLSSFSLLRLPILHSSIGNLENKLELRSNTYSGPSNKRSEKLLKSSRFLSYKFTA